MIFNWAIGDKPEQTFNLEESDFQVNKPEEVILESDVFSFKIV